MCRGNCVCKTQAVENMHTTDIHAYTCIYLVSSTCTHTCTQPQWLVIQVHVYTYRDIYIFTLLLCSDNWNEELSPITVTRFVEPVGPTTILPPTVLGVLRLFFTTMLVATIVQQTNLYAQQVIGDAADRRWTNVTANDIWAFLGFALLMGINRVPQLHH